MYAILTSKPGQYQSQADDDSTVVETYEYLFYGRLKAIYQLIRLDRETRVRITETDPPYSSNSIPTKFLEKFDTVESARAELQQLVQFGQLDAQLVRRDPPSAASNLPAMIEITFLTNSNKVISVPAKSNLLRASIREQGGIPFKCGGGLCGTCKCRIEEGLENTDEIKAKERKHLKDADFEAGYRMACQTFVNGPVKVSWKPKAH